MKRSEMIARLAEDVLTMDGFLNYSYDGHEMPTGYAEIAATIIDYLVARGMKPPIIEEKSFIMTDDGKFTYAVHEWEPEEA